MKLANCVDKLATQFGSVAHNCKQKTARICGNIIKTLVNNRK
jgi:hypothetical protein